MEVVLFASASLLCLFMNLAAPLLLRFRLALEHRLPAAYEDAVDMWVWIQAVAGVGDEPWLREYAGDGDEFERFIEPLRDAR